MHEWAHLGSDLTMIRLAQSHDAAAVHTLVHEAYDHWVPRLGRVPGPMKDDYARRIVANQVWVLEQEGEIVGLVVLEEQPESLLLENVAVLPTEQGKGYGRKLIAFAEQEAARRGFPQLQLCTNERLTENIALYAHLGFVEIGRISGEGFERICLAKPVLGGMPVRAGDAMRVTGDHLLRRVDPDYAGGGILNLVASIGRHFGSATKHPPLAHPLPLEGADTVVLVIADALGYRQLEHHLAVGDVPTLERLVGWHGASMAPITSTFPSTTPAALTTLHTGRTPAEHGLLGFTIWLPDRQTVVQTVLFRDLATGEPLRNGQGLITGPSLYQQLTVIGVSCHVIIPSRIVSSVLSEWHFAGAQVLAYASLATLPDLVAAALTGPPPRYIVIYWPDYDLVCHQHGPASSQASETVRTLDATLGQVLATSAQTEDVLMLLTADHGQRPLEPAEAILLNDDPALATWLASPPMGERCARYLRLRPGSEVAVAEHLAPVADVVQMDAVWASGLFGGPPGSEQVRLRTGDLLVVPRGRRQLLWAFTQADRGELCRGGHGGWTEWEMLVPIVAIRR